MISFITFGYSGAYTTIPKNAPALIPIVNESIGEIIPTFSTFSYFSSLIEQESCISLTHSRCWKSTSRLYLKRKSGSREEGIGLTQLTRVWRKNGTVRFDSLSGIARKYPQYLGELNWKTVRNRPDLQIKGAILLWKDNYERLKRRYKGVSEYNLLCFADAAYNGGYGGVRREIDKCWNMKGCDHKVWFGNVEKVCLKSKRKNYGRRSACEINRDHVKKVLQIRGAKYSIYNYLHFYTIDE